MRRERPAPFRGRHFEPEIIVLCVRRYLRYALSLRNLEEIMAERNVYRNEGRYKGYLKDFKGALEQYRKAEAIDRKLRARDPAASNCLKLYMEIWILLAKLPEHQRPVIGVTRLSRGVRNR